MKSFRILGLLLGLLIGATPSYAIVKSLGAGSGGGGGSGTVTSVGLTAPSVFSVSGSPVTTAGTIGVTFATGQTQNLFLATPDGTSGAIGLRAITLADLPATGANPTALVGLTAINGAASTSLRSDGAPALSQAIAPTWTNLHIFGLAGTSGTNAASIEAVSSCPIFAMENTGGATDTKWWSIDACTSTNLNFRVLNDAGVGSNWLSVTRTAGAASSITIGNGSSNPTYTFAGTGTVTVGSASAFVAGRISPTGSAIPGVGLYLPASNTLGFSTAATARGNFDANGQFNLFGVGTTSSGIFSELIASTSPIWALERTGSATDGKYWTIDASGATGITFNAVNDAFSISRAFFIANRTGVAITGEAVGNSTDNPTFTFLGSGGITVNGSIAMASTTLLSTPEVRFVAGGGTGVANGIYLSTTNTLAFVANSTGIGTWSTTVFDVLTDLAVDTLGKGLQVKEGTNGKQGTCTLAAGTCTVSTTSVTASSRIFLTAQSLGTVSVPSALAISARTAGTSFTVLASALTDTSVVAYEIFEPAP